MSVQLFCVRNLTKVSAQFVSTKDNKDLYAGDGLYVYLRDEANTNSSFEQETERLIALYSAKAKPVLKAKAITFMPVAAPILRQLAIA